MSGIESSGIETPAASSPNCSKLDPERELPEEEEEERGSSRLELDEEGDRFGRLLPHDMGSDSGP
jgi:hypothetical protein